jgi:hypothetical protein
MKADSMKRKREGLPEMKTHLKFFSSDIRRALDALGL